MEGNKIAVGFLNVVATPHPEGVYKEGFEKIANKPVRVRGKDWAVVLDPRLDAKDFEILVGRISVWTEIDSTEPSIDKITFNSQNVEESLKKIFDRRGFNNRTFNFACDLSTHIVAVELINEFGKTLTIGSAEKIFQSLFQNISTGDQYYEVTVKPEEDAIDQVLGLARLDRVHILLKRPNPGDHHGADAEEILRELDEQNLKQVEYDFRRQPKTQGIRLNERNRKRAEVAAENGYVRSSGQDEEGNKESRSTREYPKIVNDILAGGVLFSSFVKEQARRFRG